MPEGRSQRADEAQKRPALASSGQLIPNNLLFEFANPDSLKPYSNNPHKHPKQQIEQIRASIRAYGIVRPVVFDDE